MENILTLNQSIFGTKTKERRISRRALKASVQELYVPQESEEITYDEGYDIDGGAWNEVVSFVGSAINIVATFILWGHKKYYKLSWWSRIMLKGLALAGGVASLVGCSAALAKLGTVSLMKGIAAALGYLGVKYNATALLVNFMSECLGSDIELPCI